MHILVWGLLSVGGQCQVAKDASNFCSQWVSVSVLTLIVPWKVTPPKLYKGIIIDEYFGTGTKVTHRYTTSNIVVVRQFLPGQFLSKAPPNTIPLRSVPP